MSRFISTVLTAVAFGNIASMAATKKPIIDPFDPADNVFNRNKNKYRSSAHDPFRVRRGNASVPHLNSASAHKTGMNYIDGVAYNTEDVSDYINGDCVIEGYNPYW